MNPWKKKHLKSRLKFLLKTKQNRVIEQSMAKKEMIAEVNKIEKEQK